MSISMRIIHLPFGFYPDPVGGTEVYVASLARYLQQRGETVIIAAPGESSSAYKSNGLAVRRFAVSNGVSDISELYGSGDEIASREFAEILDEEQPDVVHLHAFSRGASLRMVREAKRRNISVVFTYHTPTVSCQRGSLMRWGREVCDGLLDVKLCTACTLHGLGLVKPLARAVASLPLSLTSLPDKFGLQGGAWTALRMTELIALRHSAFRNLMQEIDHIVVLCQWSKDLLVRNGVPAEKITLSRHGLSQMSEVRGRKPEVGEEGAGRGEHGVRSKEQGAGSTERKAQNAEGRQHGARGSEPKAKENPQSAIRNPQFPLKIAFLGRLDPIKGPDILIKAVRRLPNALLELDLYGIVQSNDGLAFRQELERSADGDPRIRFLPPVESARVVSLLRTYDLLAVPSRWLETGPLVVLEAFAAGIPVIGSNLGGISELVEAEIDGVLVEDDSIEAWSRAIRRFCEDHCFLERLRRGIRPPRRMDAVAEEMMVLYNEVLGMQTADQHKRSWNRGTYADG
jgi:glycosyltransferase involved in cell wall biosynthesis